MWQTLSLNRNWPKMSKTSRKGSSDTLKTSRNRKSLSPLLNRRDEPVTNDAGRPEGLHTSFASASMNAAGFQAMGTTVQADADTDPFAVREELVCQLLQGLDSS